MRDYSNDDDEYKTIDELMKHQAQQQDDEEQQDETRSGTQSKAQFNETINDAFSSTEPIVFTADGSLSLKTKNAASKAIREPHAGIINDATLPKASIIFYHRPSSSIISYGDCQCLVDDNKYAFEKEIDVYHARIRALVNDAALSESSIDELRRDDVGRKAIINRIKHQSTYENNSHSPYGFAVINGLGTINKVLMRGLKVHHGQEIVLSSDGYPSAALNRTLASSEEKLKELLFNDPLCIYENKQTKGIVNG